MNSIESANVNDAKSNVESTNLANINNVIYSVVIVVHMWYDMFYSKLSEESSTT